MLWRLLRSLLFLLPAETAHHVGFAGLRLLQLLPGATSLVGWFLRPRDPRTRVRALGLDFPSPVGMAAGFDKDARAYEALGALGFGFVEVGTLTARPQPGNPKPRLFRLPADRALVNRLGFNNHGAEAAAPRLRRPRRTIVGVNIGKSKAATESEAVEDYAFSARTVGVLGDYVVVNVSSPNTPGLRDLQAVEKLRPILVAVRRALDEGSPGKRIPLLVKIAPDLADEDVDRVSELALELGLDGIVATNTTIARTGLRTPAEQVAALGSGGLSGAPLKERSLQVLRRVRARVGERLVVISVGGLETAEEVRERLAAGATLVQLYTGFIYGGPLLPWRLQRALARPAHSL